MLKQQEGNVTQCSSLFNINKFKFVKLNLKTTSIKHINQVTNQFNQFNKSDFLLV